MVHLDGCVEVEAAYYGLPPGWIGRSVKVQWDALHVRILHPDTNQFLCEHIRQYLVFSRIEDEDQSKKMSLVGRGSCVVCSQLAHKRASSVNSFLTQGKTASVLRGV